MCTDVLQKNMISGNNFWTVKTMLINHLNWSFNIGALPAHAVLYL